MGDNTRPAIGPMASAPAHQPEVRTPAHAVPCCGVGSYANFGADGAIRFDAGRALGKQTQLLVQSPVGQISGINPDAWQDRLYSPTFFTKIGSDYFIVDCWHNRVLYTEASGGEIDWDISTWKVMDAQLAGPHSIASDGEIYVVEDTGHHAIVVYRKTDYGFERIQKIEGMGVRPHRVRYDSATKSFYVLSATSQEITRLVREGDGLKVLYRKHLPFLGGRYSRSMTIIDGEMYLTASDFPGYIIQVKYLDDSYEVVKRWHMPGHIHGINDIFRTGDGWIYVTYSSHVAGAIRARSMQEIASGKWEDVRLEIGLEDTPYYLSEVDGRIYVPEISEDGCNAIHSFRHGENGRITDVGSDVFFDEPLPQSIEAKGNLPK